MAAGILDLTAEHGVTLTVVLTWYSQAADGTQTLTNLTGWTGVCKIIDALDTVLNVTPTLGGSAGTITISVSATQTAAMALGLGRYDLKLTDTTSGVWRPVEGAFEVRAVV